MLLLTVLKVLAWALALAIGLYLGLIVQAMVQQTMLYLKAKKTLVGPPGHAIFGNFALIKKHKGEFLPMMREVLSTYGNAVLIRFLSRPVVIVSDVESARTLWLTKNCPKGSLYKALTQMFGRGLVTAEGETWKSHRKILSGGFTPQQLRFFIPAFQKHIDILLSVMTRDLGTRKGPVELKVDSYFTHATLDIIATTALRFNLNNLGGENQAVGGSFSSILRNSTNSPLMMLPFGGYIQRLRLWRDFRTVDRILNEAVDRGMKDPPPTDGPPRDLLDILIGAGELTRQEIIDELFIFFLAGHETTALTLTWCLHELSLRPDIMARLRTEIAQVCGDRPPTADELSRLVVLGDVLKETLRMHAPVGGLTRTLTEDMVVGDRVVPKGMSVMVSIDSVHRNPTYWENPDLFDPDRFTEERSVGRNPFAFMPFTNGPRICIGQHFFTIEAKMILVQLLQRFDFAPVPGFPVVASSLAGTVKPKHGLKLLVSART